MSSYFLGEGPNFDFAPLSHCDDSMLARYERHPVDMPVMSKDCDLPRWVETPHSYAAVPGTVPALSTSDSKVLTIGRDIRGDGVLRSIGRELKCAPAGGNVPEYMLFPHGEEILAVRMESHAGDRLVVFEVL